MRSHLSPPAQDALYFVTGSSGSGKTTLLKGVVAEIYPELRTFHVDAEAARAAGPSRVRGWVERAALGGEAPGLLVMDGQERPHEVLAMAREVGLAAVYVILIDCGHAERRRRLLEDRRQPELDQLDMYAWAAYLRGQADALGLEVLDTTGQPLTASIAALGASIGAFARSIDVRLTSVTR